MISRLKKQLEESQFNLDELKEHIKVLIASNRELEVVVRKLLEQKAETKLNYEYVTIDLTRDNKSLKSQLGTLKENNDELQKKLIDLGSKLKKKA